MLYRPSSSGLQLLRELHQGTPGYPHSGPRTGARRVQLTKKSEIQNALAQADAIGRSQAVIEFRLDGTIVTPNKNMLDTVGYTLDEIRGKHGMFIDKAEALAHR
jgi:PAS domain-containing protein